MKKELIVVGDRVLVEPEVGEERTRVGLYLPQTAIESRAVQGGRVVALGPGVPVGPLEEGDSAKKRKEKATQQNNQVQQHHFAEDLKIFIRGQAAGDYIPEPLLDSVHSILTNFRRG